MKFKIKNKEVEISTHFYTSNELFLIPTIGVALEYWNYNKERKNYVIEFSFLKYNFIIRFIIV